MKIKKVLLLSPPAFTFKDDLDINPLPALGLAYIAAVLEEMGIQVKIYDSLVEGWHLREEVSPAIIKVGAAFKDIEQQIIDYNPDMVGVNNLFTRQRANAHRIHAIAKKINPNIITVAGGAHPTVMPELVMEDKNVDYIVMGEGERTIMDLIEYLEGKKDLADMNGIAFRDNGAAKIIPKTRFIDDLDTIPFPARHLLNLDKYFGLELSHGKRRHKFFSPIVTSRGCPANCTFCSAHHVGGRGYRKRSPENVLEEMRELKNKFGIKELMFEDDNVTLDMRRADKIFDLMIEEKMGFEWDTPNGVAAFALNEKLINKMKDAGCYQLNLAIESGNTEVLKNIIKKPLDLSKVKPMVEYARSIGLNVGIFLVLGMPGESLDQMWDSFRFSKELGIYTPFISIATPYPGSELYKICVENDYIPQNYSLDNLYISSYSISTKDWESEEVRRIFEEGQLYLQKAFYKKHPFLLIKKLIEKLLKDPFGLVRKCSIALKVRE